MRSNIPSRTSISVGLRVIPPGSGFARSVVKTAGKSISVAHHWPDRTQGKKVLRVVKDEELEREIREWQAKR